MRCFVNFMGRKMFLVMILSVAILIGTTISSHATAVFSIDGSLDVWIGEWIGHTNQPEDINVWASQFGPSPWTILEDGNAEVTYSGNPAGSGVSLDLTSSGWADAPPDSRAFSYGRTSGEIHIQNNSTDTTYQFEIGYGISASISTSIDDPVTEEAEAEIGFNIYTPSPFDPFSDIVFLNIDWDVSGNDEFAESFTGQDWYSVAPGELLNIYAGIGLQGDASALTPAPVPEPTTILLLGTGLVGIVGVGRKKFFKK